MVFRILCSTLLAALLVGCGFSTSSRIVIEAPRPDADFSGGVTYITAHWANQAQRMDVRLTSAAPRSPEGYHACDACRAYELESEYLSPIHLETYLIQPSTLVIWLEQEGAVSPRNFRDLERSTLSRAAVAFPKARIEIYDDPIEADPWLTTSE